MMKITVFIVLVALAGSWAQVAKYDGYKVFRLMPTTDEHLALLRQFEDHTTEYDFWKSPTGKNMPVEIMVAPHKFAEFQEIVNTVQIQSRAYIEDVQKLIDENTPKYKSKRSLDWNNYYNGNEINTWLDGLAAKYPDQVTVVIGGRSYEGRDIKGVKVSFKEGNKGVFIESGIHAREWIAPATVTYILNELLTSQDPNVRDIAENYDWYIFPSTNPDGYEYTHTNDRLWRKTRQPYGLLCKGADPNRNWGYHWMDGGASSFPCSETYAGTSPFSEPETKSLSEFIRSVADNLVAYIGFHSFSQLLLIPYGHSSAHVENYNDLLSIGKKAAASLEQRYGTTYTVGNIVDVLDVASGSSMDWVKGTFQTPITFTYELRDKGDYGFVLPAEQIIPTAEETLDSLVTLLHEARSLGY